MKAVMTEELSKTYPGGNRAVESLNLSIEKGEVFGFLGPNGAGKTTTIKLLCGILTPTSGKCGVFGIDPALNPEKLHAITGIITENARMYDHLSGMDNLLFYGALFGLGESECKKKALSLLERLNLTDSRQDKLSSYSTGMRQRLSLARAMIHDPEILFLDEPTSGLDPESSQNVNSMITELAAKGTTVFLCTHQLRYAREICTSYGLMNRGALLAAGSFEELSGMVSPGIKVRIETDLAPEDIISVSNTTLNTKLRGDKPEDFKPECFQSNGLKPLGFKPLVSDSQSSVGLSYEITLNSKEEIPLIVRGIVEAGGEIYHVSAQSVSLEEIYFSLMEKNQLKAEAKENE
ncbi:MAG: ABC transporter ATP-binding protein [Eubacteriaceae bacterium]|nr:ABC transporter ATP-binding protein [Eubacteriaceae bacterium]